MERHIPERLFPWSERMQGARLMLYRLNEDGCLNLSPGISKKDGGPIYHKAIYDLLMDDLTNIDRYLIRDDIFFTDHQNDDKGKLISCRATFTDSRPTRKRK